MRLIWLAFSLLFCSLLCCLAEADTTPGAAAASQPSASVTVDPAAADAAARLLKAGKRDAGLCVYLGPDAKLAAALHVCSDRRMLVVQLDPSSQVIDKAREYLQSLGIYGPVSAEAFSGLALPLADNLATVVVVEDVGALQTVPGSKPGVTVAEIARILQPGGVAIMGNTPADMDKWLDPVTRTPFARGESSGRWTAFTRPRPAGMDEWTHPRHAADGNLVSHDKLVGPPKQFQWLAGPVYPMAGDYAYQAILSAGGRNYYLLSPGQIVLATFTGPTVSDDPAQLPGGRGSGAGHYLMARDAFNGLPLWRRRLDGPATALVADAERVYAIHNGLAVAIDGVSGKIVANYGRAEGGYVGRFLLQGGKLLIVGTKEIRAIDVATGKQAWTVPIAWPVQIVADDQLIIFNEKAHDVRAIDLAGGKENWKTDSSAWITTGQPKSSLLFARDGIVVFDADMGKENTKYVTAISAKDGKLLWSYKYAWPAPANPTLGQMRWSAFYASGQVWLQKWSVEGEKGPTALQKWEALDPKTGAVSRSLASIKPSTAGCFLDVATDRYVVFNRPADFLDLLDGTVSRFRASRPTCRNGATLGNGLYYSAPNMCVCVAGIVSAYVGMGAGTTQPESNPAAQAAQAARLVSGPAMGKTPTAPAPDGSDWPTFRHDPARSASTPAKVADKLKVLWQSPTLPLAGASAAGTLLSDESAADVAGDDRITASTVAGERVFVSCPREHRVIALDRGSGKGVWSVTLGCRLDTPPTIDGGMCLVGCRDGWVYALRATDGELAWRFRVAPHERQIIAFGQIESPCPVVGGVLVKDGVAVAVAGRTSESDGGVIVCGLEPATGKLLWQQCLAGATDEAKGFVGLADIPVADERCVSVGGSTPSRMELKTGKPLPREQINALRAGTRNGQYHAYIGPVGSLMDRTWHTGANGTVQGRYNVQWNAGLTGQIVVFDAQHVVAAQRKLPAAAGQKLATTVLARDQEKVGPIVAAPKGPPLWSISLPERQVEAMALAGEQLLLAVVSADRAIGQLLVLSMKDGGKIAELGLPAPVCSEGIAVAGGRVYVSLANGQVMCLGE